MAHVNMEETFGPRPSGRKAKQALATAINRPLGNESPGPCSFTVFLFAWFQVLTLSHSNQVVGDGSLGQDAADTVEGQNRLLNIVLSHTKFKSCKATKIKQLAKKYTSVGHIPSNPTAPRENQGFLLDSYSHLVPELKIDPEFERKPSAGRQNSGSGHGEARGGEKCGTEVGRVVRGRLVHKGNQVQAPG